MRLGSGSNRSQVFFLDRVEHSNHAFLFHGLMIHEPEA